MKKNSKSALNIMQPVIVLGILFVLAISIQLIDKNLGAQVAKINMNKDIQEVESDIQEEIQVADSFEREIKITSRTETERPKNNEESEKEINIPTIEIKAAQAVVGYKTIDEVTISRDMDLTVSCGLSREDFIILMTNARKDTSGFFERNAGTIYDLCEKYELNEIFFCGLIAGESGWNIASSHRNAHNYISMMSGGKLIRYSSDSEGLEAAAKLLHNKYLSEGGSYYRGKTLSAMQKIFCPNSTTWVGLIYTCMSQALS